MQIDQLIKVVETALEDLKARDVDLIDVRGKSTVTDYMMIACGTSKRHVVSIADEVKEKVKAAGVMPVGSEGEEDGEWVLVDLGEVIVHIMMPDARSYYDLEKLWTFESLEEGETEKAGS